MSEIWGYNSKVEQGDVVRSAGLSRRARQAIIETSYNVICISRQRRFSAQPLLHLVQREFVEATTLYTRALAIQEKVLDPDHPDLALTLNNLGVVCFKQVRVFYICLIELIVQLDLRRWASGRLVPRGFHPVVSRGQVTEAQHLNSWRWVVADVGWGPNHPVVTPSLKPLALLLERNMNVDPYRVLRLVPFYNRALSIQARALGLDHPDLAITLTHLGRGFEQQVRACYNWII